MRQVREVALLIRDEALATVLVMAGGRLRGRVTDRDLVVRLMAEGRDPRVTTMETVCSPTLLTVAPEDTIDWVAGLMRDAEVALVPVVRGRPPHRRRHTERRGRRPRPLHRSARDQRR